MNRRNNCVGYHSDYFDSGPLKYVTKERYRLFPNEDWRCHRDKENQIIEELAELLPLPAEAVKQLDRATIIKLAKNYLKMKNFLHDLEFKQATPHPQESNIRELVSRSLQTLDGFIFLVEPNGTIMYISESVVLHLGLTPINLIGNSIFDYIHPADRDEMTSILNLQQLQTYEHSDIQIERKFVIRMKCFLTKEYVGILNHGWKVIHCRGNLKVRKCCFNVSADVCKDIYKLHNIGLAAVGDSLSSSPRKEINLYSNMFLFRASLDLTLMYTDSNCDKLTRYGPLDLIGKTLYKCIHASDIRDLEYAHLGLLMKSQATTKYYRFLIKTGGWVWVQSHMFIIEDHRKGVSQMMIISVNNVLSGIEEPDLILNSDQKMIKAKPFEEESPKVYIVHHCFCCSHQHLCSSR